MYRKIKLLIKAIIPKRILFKYEPYFRFIQYQFYKGKPYQCNICNKKLRRFIQLEDEDKLCPNCGSLSRTRRLWQILDSEFLKEKISILDFSPSRSIYRVLKGNSLLSYISSDLSRDFLSDVKFDITKIESHNDTYDLIICYHILEHIEDDYSAMKELYRVLKIDGVCIIQTPFKQGEIYEDSSIKSEEARTQHFGQKDHLRIYSTNGLKERLKECGFQVEIREYNNDVNNENGYKRNESILICTK